MKEQEDVRDNLSRRAFMRYAREHTRALIGATSIGGLLLLWEQDAERGKVHQKNVVLSENTPVLDLSLEDLNNAYYADLSANSFLQTHLIRIQTLSPYDQSWFGSVIRMDNGNQYQFRVFYENNITVDSYLYQISETVASDTSIDTPQGKLFFSVSEVDCNFLAPVNFFDQVINGQRIGDTVDINTVLSKLKFQMVTVQELLPGQRGTLRIDSQKVVMPILHSIAK